MDISYYKSYEPFWGKWYIKREIGRGSYGTVFEIECQEMGHIYKSALKIITIPKDNNEIAQTMRNEGMLEGDVSNYYKDIAQYFYRECMLMAKFKGNTNIVGYEDHQIIQHTDGIGWDILIRMELLTPLRDYLQTVTVDESLVKRIAIDICNALELCERENVLHRDIKPENIFVNSNGAFKLGDFGVARVLSATNGAATKVGTVDYLAPEVFIGNQNYDKRADIYSLGMVMYRLLNMNRMPFLPLPPAVISYTQKEEAQHRRMQGDLMQPPVQASESMAKIILKACSYYPNNRFFSAKDLKDAIELENMARLTAANVQMPNQYSQFQERNYQFAQNQSEQFLRQNMLQMQYQNESVAKKKDLKTGIIFALIAIIITLATTIGFLIPSILKNDDAEVGEANTPIRDELSTNNIVDDTEKQPEYKFSVGDTVTIGWVKDDIEWLVLDIQGDKALLWQKLIIDGAVFDENNNSWENSDIREWLNSKYYEKTFESVEKEIICTSMLKTEGNYSYGAGESYTEDKVFLLSVEEVQHYLANDEGYIEGYAESDNDWLWLRSPGETPGKTAIISSSGMLYEEGYDSNENGAIRPAMWVDAKNGEEILVGNIPRSSGLYAEKSNDGSSGNDMATELGNSVNIGDSIKFGNFNGKIEWNVLDLNGDYALIITRDILGGAAYSTYDPDGLWENSDVRAWLNAQFVEENFSSEEASIICSTRIMNQNNEKYGTNGGDSTEDMAFLLSIDEAEKYFSSDESRKALAKEEGSDGNMIYSYWILRTPGKTNEFVSCVKEDGHISQKGVSIDDENCGIRPAMWIDLKAGKDIIEVVSNADTRDDTTGLLYE